MLMRVGVDDMKLDKKYIFSIACDAAGWIMLGLMPICWKVSAELRDKKLCCMSAIHDLFHDVHLWYHRWFEHFARAALISRLPG